MNNFRNREKESEKNAQRWGLIETERRERGGETETETGGVSETEREGSTV